MNTTSRLRAAWRDTGNNRSHAREISMALKMVVLTGASLALNCAFMFRQPWMAVAAGCGYAVALAWVD